MCVFTICQIRCLQTELLLLFILSVDAGQRLCIPLPEMLLVCFDSDLDGGIIFRGGDWIVHSVRAARYLAFSLEVPSKCQLVSIRLVVSVTFAGKWLRSTANLHFTGCRNNILKRIIKWY